MKIHWYFTWSVIELKADVIIQVTPTWMNYDL